jgi:hypothetical protein
MLSNCCGYPPHWETDLCSNCLEHAEFYSEDEEDDTNLLFI